MPSWPFKSRPKSSCQCNQAASNHRNNQGRATFTQNTDERKERGNKPYGQSSRQPSYVSPFTASNPTFDLLVQETFRVKFIISDSPTGLLSAFLSSGICETCCSSADILSSIGPSNLMTERSRPQ